MPPSRANASVVEGSTADGGPGLARSRAGEPACRTAAAGDGERVEQPETTAGAGQPGPGQAGASLPAARGGSALRGSVWTTAGFATGQILRFLANLLLTRLLYPAAFGQMALVSTLIQGLQMFSDIGTGPAIIQSQRGDDPRFLDTAWTLQAFRGVALWLLSLAVAWPAASLYGQPELTALVPVTALFCIMAGLESTAVQTEQRRLRLERVVLLDVGSQAAAALATVVFAVAHRRYVGEGQPGAVWALVGGTLAGGALRLVLSHVMLPGHRHRFHLEPEARRALLAFGRWVFVSTLLTFFAGQLDRLLFGKVVPLDVLGIYGIALALATIPTLLVQRLARSILFPTFSRLERESRLAGEFDRLRLPLLAGGAALASMLLAAGRPAVALLYDSRYAEAGWIVQVLASGVWFQILESASGAALLAQGRVTWHAGASAAKLLALVVLIPVGFRLDGFRGAVFAIALSDGLRYVVSALGVRLRGIPFVCNDGLLTVGVVATSALGIWAGSTAASGGSRPLVAFLVSSAAAGIPWLAVFWYAFRRVRAPHPAGA